MPGDLGSIEGMLSMAGVAIAAAVVMLVVFALSRPAASADVTISLHAVADEICGDIGTAATSAVPYGCNVTCPVPGVEITSDYVIVASGPGQSFARPLAVRVYPGNYSGPDGSRWNGTGDMRRQFGARFGGNGTREAPLSLENGSRVAALLDVAGREMDARPLAVDASLPLTIEKLFVYTHNDSSGATECEPYVFVYQR